MKYRALIPVLVLASILTAPAFAATSRDGTCSGTSTSCTYSATATNDLKLMYAYRSSSATAPSLPAGWTQIATGSDASTDSWILGCNVSSSSGDTGSGTWTNATRVVGISYSGTAVGTTANCNTTGIGGKAGTSSAGALSTTFTIVGITLNATDWVAGFGGDNSQAVCAPTGMTSEVTAGTSLQRAIGMDTTAPVGSWSSSNCTITSSVWATYTVEILVAGGGGATTVKRKGTGVF